MRIFAGNFGTIFGRGESKPLLTPPRAWSVDGRERERERGCKILSLNLSLKFRWIQFETVIILGKEEAGVLSDKWAASLALIIVGQTPAESKSIMLLDLPLLLVQIFFLSSFFNFFGLFFNHCLLFIMHRFCRAWACQGCCRFHS